MIEKLNRTAVSAERNGQAGSSPARKGKGNPGEDFATELLGMVGQQQPALQAMPKGQGEMMEALATAAQTAQNLTQAQDGKSLAMVESEKSPLNAKSAAGMNTAAAIAGLKPWSKEWVFEGMDRNADLNPLFSGANGTDTRMEALAAQVLKGERTRGEAEFGQENLASALAKAQGEMTSPEGMAKAVGAAPEGNGVVAVDELVSRHLRELDGELISAGSQARAGERAVGLNGGPARAVPNTGLSGGEFLNALNAGKAGQNAGTQGGQTGGGGSEFSGKGAPELKVIEGGLKGKKTSLKDELFASNLAQAGTAEAIYGGGKLPASPGATQVTGHVVQGAMAQERLTSQSLEGIATGIRNFSTQGGGEMRVRLNPDNLGELHVRVVTQGSQVGLTIQASDEKAKKIIEESLSHLKDSLASQRLSLGQVDVTTVSGTQQNASLGDSSEQQGQSRNQQQSFGNFMDQNRGSGMWNQGGNEGGSSRGWNDRGSDDAVRAMGSSSGIGATASARRAVSAGSGRLDVRA